MMVKWLSKAAITRPINKSAYGEENLMAFAAAHLFGIVRNHHYSDANERTGFLAAYTFLLINGYEIVTDQSTIIEFVLAVSAGEIDEME